MDDGLLETLERLVGIVVFILVWIVPILLRFLKKFRRRDAPAETPAPHPVEEETPQPGTVLAEVLSSAGAAWDPREDLEMAATAIERLLERSRHVRALGTGSRAARLGRALDEVVADPARDLLGEVREALESDDPRDSTISLPDVMRAVTEMGAALDHLERVIVTQSRGPVDEAGRRGEALTRVLLDRVSGLRRRAGLPSVEPVLVPLPLDPGVPIEAAHRIASARIVCYDPTPAMGEDPTDWIHLVRDVVGWTLLELPGVHEEIEVRHEEALASHGLPPRRTSPALVRNVWVDAVTTLVVGPLHEDLTGGDGESTRDRLLASVTDLAGPRPPRPGETGLPIEVDLLARVIVTGSLDAFSGRRMTDDPTLVFDHADAAGEKRAAADLLEGRAPQVGNFALLLGAMRSARKRPDLAETIAGLADEALGVAGRRGDRRGEADPAPSGQATGRGWLEPAALPEAVALGAILARPSR